LNMILEALRSSTEAESSARECRC